MDKDKGQPGKIDRILVGDPMGEGGYTLRPVARLGGWAGKGEGEQGRGFGGLLRIQPLEVRVSGPDGDDYTVSVTDPTQEAVRRIALIGLLVAAVSALLILVGLLRPRNVA
jgi:hypothetical protein